MCPQDYADRDEVVGKRVLNKYPCKIRHRNTDKLRTVYGAICGVVAAQVFGVGQEEVIQVDVDGEHRPDEHLVYEGEHSILRNPMDALNE